MVLVAGVVNLLVSGAAFAAAGNRLVPASPSSQPAEIRNATGTRNPEREPTALLVFFGVSGFVAIGYEIVWAKVFGIVMEGTLYGFATVLSANLCGIALGSAAVAPFVDRIRDLPRAFGALHLAIPVSVVLGMLAVPDLPFVLEQLAGSTGAGDAVHLLFVIVAPIVLVPTALFGAAFPILIRLFSRRAETAGHSVGIATAVNTAGSIAASVLVGLWSIPRIGTNATLYALLLLELGVALMVLLRFQTSRGRERVAVTGLAGALGIVLALSFNGVNVAEALSGRQVRATSLAEYREILDTKSASLIYLAEGKNAVVSVEETPQLRRVSTNGLSEAALAFAPPYYSKETILLAALPYLIADSPERSLVVGLGGGNTVAGLVATGVHSIDVVELEGKIVEAVTLLFEGRANPLADPRVTVRINDGRNELLRGRHLPEARFDIITSQPSHPWRAGAASLFTEEFFQLARANLSPGGVFASWIDGFRLDAGSLLAVMASFDRAFPGGMVVNGSSGDSRKSFILLGALEPLSVSTDRMAARMAEPALRELLALFEMRSVEEVLARFDAPVASFAALSPELANTDDNAFVETRIPRKLRWRNLDWLALESRLDANTPLLPPLRGGVDLEAIVQAVLQSEDDTRWSDGQKLERLLRVHGGEISPVAKAIWLAEASLRHPRSEQQALDRLAALGEHHPGNPEPLRVVGRHLVSRRGEGRDAARWFAAAWERSRDPSDAYAAGAAIADLDPDRAERWFARIPEPERARFPGLALHIARRSLAQGLSGKMLRPAYQALLQYRQTPEGWSVKGIDELLARIAAAVGERRGAIRLAERARRARARGAVESRRRSPSTPAWRLSAGVGSASAGRRGAPRRPCSRGTEGARGHCAG
jgi:predicted membrane-bound spermidine synthase